MSEAITTTDVRRGWTSASNALPDSLCPGRHLAQRGIPEPVKSAEASAGSRIHAALAGEIQPLTLSLDEREMFDSCREVEKKVVLQFFGAESPAMKVFRHERYWASWTDHAGKAVEHSGEFDVVWRAGTKALVADYKTGNNEAPESPRNLQLRDLAILIRGAFINVSELGAVIIQPLVTHSPDICVYTPDDLKRSEIETAKRVFASNDPASPRIAGEEQCKFCLAKTRCKEYQTWASAVLPLKALEVFEVPMVNWSTDQRSRAMAAVKPAYDLLEQIENMVKEGLANDPSFCPGWTLAPGRKLSSITDPQKVFERFTALGGTAEQFLRTVSVQKTKLKEAVNEVTGEKGKGLDKAIDTLTDGCLETKVSDPSLKKVDA